ncbi:MAG: alpha-amylase family glycosyl hydrolase, partial [Oscillospiraceae bacterium]|nr:alpha-amylase family glycosyl hydrolase [Oscillospiraceae bacterium]
MIPFDSRDAKYKSPFGAVCEGQRIQFSVCLPESGAGAVFLAVKRDACPFEYHNMNKNNDGFWSLEYDAPEKGLYWYRFEFDGSDGRQKITRVKNGAGEINENGGDWQLTVYSESFKTPDWIKGGVIYQIFPDRFNFSGEKKDSIPADRILRPDWGGIPEYRPAPNGKILNNDYFQGDFKGITEKLPYLSSQGVTCIYLNPIFEAHSNHRYDTADYMKPDGLLGSPEDFKRLCEEAHAAGI